jgi:hypothetical protein
MRVSNVDATVKQLADEMKAVGVEEEKLDAQEKGHSEDPPIAATWITYSRLIRHICFAPSNLLKSACNWIDFLCRMFSPVPVDIDIQVGQKGLPGALGPKGFPGLEGRAGTHTFPFSDTLTQSLQNVSRVM